MKTLIACTMHIFFYNFFDIADFAEASDLRTSVSEILESHDNDWTSAPFQTAFDLPKNIALLADKVGIHFPANAAQPPSDQVRIFANLSEGSEVTDWYMRAFGLMPLPDSAEYAKAGWRERKAVPIINLSDSMDETKVVDPCNICRFFSFLNCFKFGRISRKELFIREFRKIANNPIGRALLYRILIEIRRHKPGSSSGIVENHYKIESLHESDLNLTSLKQFREHSRCLNINWNPDEFNFSPNNTCTSTLNFNNTTIQKTHVTGYLEDSGNFLIQPQPSCIVDDLFHELLHWYHLLRDPLRFYLDAHSQDALIDERCGSVYYEWVKSEYQKKLSTISWYGESTIKVDDTVYHANFEELRTILGFHPVLALFEVPYLEGDDISENLFLISNYKQLRFGHKNLPYVEHNSPVTRATEAVRLTLQTYTGRNLKTPKIPKLNSSSASYFFEKNSITEIGDFGTMYHHITKDLIKNLHL